MAKKELPSPEYLRKRLGYDPTIGDLKWRRCAEMRSQWNARYPGKPALNCKNKGGYLTGDVNGFQVRAHRVIWAMQTGAWPAGEIDHINGVRDDNRWNNLRDVSSAQNGRNKRLSAKNKTGVVGVSYHKQTQKWVSYIASDSGRQHLGVYVNFDDAVNARRAAERRHGYHENHGRKVAQ